MKNNIFNLKKEKNKKLKKDFGFLLKYSPLGLIKLQDKGLLIDLRDGLITLPAAFIVEIEGIETEKIGENIIATGKINKNDLAGFDFVVFDECNVNISDYSENGIIPIIKNDCHLSLLLKQFDPIKNEGNSFLFEDFNKWSIFTSIVKYIENFKFPYDNKNLVNKIVSL